MYVYFDVKFPNNCQPLGDKFCVLSAKPDSIVLNHSGNNQLFYTTFRKHPSQLVHLLTKDNVIKRSYGSFVISRLMTVVHV